MNDGVFLPDLVSKTAEDNANHNALVPDVVFDGSHMTILHGNAFFTKECCSFCSFL